jgi:hypothetical protein
VYGQRGTSTPPLSQRINSVAVSDGFFNIRPHCPSQRAFAAPHFGQQRGHTLNASVRARRRPLGHLRSAPRQDLARSDLRENLLATSSGRALKMVDGSSRQMDSTRRRGDPLRGNTNSTVSKTRFESGCIKQSSGRLVYLHFSLVGCVCDDAQTFLSNERVTTIGAYTSSVCPGCHH